MKKNNQANRASLVLSYFDIRKLKPYEIIWFIAISIVGLFLTILVPPFEKPDEHVHFYKASSIANGLFFCLDPNKDTLIQAKYFQLMNDVGKYRLTQNPSSKFYYKEYIKQPFDNENGRSIVQEKTSALCGFSPIAYIPQSVGLFLANAASLNGIYSFYVGRLFALVTFLVALLLILIAIKPNGRIIFLATASIPMLLHQVGSYSYDSVHITACLILGAFAFSIIESTKVSLRFLFATIILSIICVLIKGQSYIFFLFIPFLAINKVYNSSRFFRVFKYVLVALILLVSVMWALLVVNSQLKSFSTTFTPSDSNLQLLAMKKDPSLFISALSYTTDMKFQFYATSLVGNFGWLDNQLQHSGYIFYILLLGLCINSFRFDNKKAFNIYSLAILTSIFVGSYILMHLGLYISHSATYTGIGTLLIEGFQGRYLLALIPIVFLIIGLVRQSSLLKNIAIASLGLFAIYSVANTTYNRYYNYSVLYDLLADNNQSDDGGQPKSLENMFEVTLDLDENAKYVGLQVYALNESKVMPYWVELTSGDCQDKTEIIDNLVFQYRPELQNNILLTKTYKSNRIVCVTLEPLATPNADFDPLLVKSSFLRPLKLYN